MFRFSSVRGGFRLLLRGQDRNGEAFCLMSQGERGKSVSLVQRRRRRDVPAVSNARRLVDRLQGGQHCRRALEIRSEVSAPALMVPRYSDAIRRLSALLFSGSGGLGVRVDAFRISPRVPSSPNESGHGGLCPHPPRLKTLWVFKSALQTADVSIQRIETRHRWKLSFLRTFLLLPPLRTEGHYETRRRRKPRPPRRSAVSSNQPNPRRNTAAGCAVTMAAQPVS